MTRAELLTHLKALGTVDSLTDAQLSAYIDEALNAMAQYQPRRYRLVGVPADNDDGIYSDVIPANAIDVEGVFETETDVKIDFEVVEKTDGRQLWLKGVRLPSYIGITTYAGQVQDFSDFYYNDAAGYSPSRRYTGSFDAFDVVYTVPIEIVHLKPPHLTAVKCYVEALGYRHAAGLDENLSDIVDRAANGESTTFRQSQKSKNYQMLSEKAMSEFKRVVIRPVFNISSFGEIQKYWSPGEIS
ncbi:MAG: hypothetical protein OXL96_21130 [Candidatus Poribacteria bacterium]|nr:hypothetical protein [Candidatus Poribacteria bacterium]